MIIRRRPILTPIALRVQLGRVVLSTSLAHNEVALCDALGWILTVTVGALEDESFDGAVFAGVDAVHLVELEGSRGVPETLVWK